MPHDTVIQGPVRQLDQRVGKNAEIPTSYWAYLHRCWSPLG